MSFPIKRSLLLFLILISFPGRLLEAETIEVFPLSEVKPGLKGTGKTVFKGSRVEPFEVEIMGVLEKIGPGQNLILARLSGELVNSYGVFAGMSGSPVYIDGKLVGAVAYAFSFATAPIAGITPFQEMIDVFVDHGSQASLRVARKVSPASLYSVAESKAPWAQPFLGGPASSDLRLPATGQLRPIQTPLSLTNISALAVSPLVPALEGWGLTPVFGAAGRAPDATEVGPLEPGSTIAVQLLRGDLEVSASGTVTHVSGDKVYAFGHPFLGLGSTDLPLTKASVLGVIPSLMSSQKISATGEAIGSIRQDRSPGILGYQGQEPRMVPVELSLLTSRGEQRKLRYEVVGDSFLTPFLIAFSVQSSIVATERSIGGQTLQVKCKIALKGQPEAVFENSISDLTSSSTLAALTAAAPVDFLLNAGFDNVEIERIGIELKAFEKTREAILEKVWQDDVEVRPGQELGITVFLRRPNGEVIPEKYPVKIPEGMTPGPLKILVGDGMTLTKVDATADDGGFLPKDIGQLVRAINNLKKNDRLYIRLFREQPGAVIAGEGLPGLPPSLLSLYSSEKTSGDIAPIKFVVYVEHELPATDFVLIGQKVIEVVVKG